MASKKAAKKKAAKKAVKKTAKKAAPKSPAKTGAKTGRKAATKAPPRTSARGADAKRKMSGRTKTGRGQKQQSAARIAAQTPQRKAGVKAPAVGRAAAKPARTSAAPSSGAKERSAPRTQGAPAEKRRERSPKRRQQGRDASPDLMMEMPPATREEREQRPQFMQDDEARPQFGGGDDAAGQQQSAATPEDEGYGRSEGPDKSRIGQAGEYPADDDELHYGRNLGGRNRIPGGGSRRNR